MADKLTPKEEAFPRGWVERQIRLDQTNSTWVNWSVAAFIAAHVVSLVGQVYLW